MISYCVSKKTYLTIFEMKDLNDSKLIWNKSKWTPNPLGSIWYHSEPSEVQPLLYKQVTGQVRFLGQYSKMALIKITNQKKLALI